MSESLMARELLTEIRDELRKLRAAVGAVYLRGGPFGDIGPIKASAWQALTELSLQPEPVDRSPGECESPSDAAEHR